MGRSDYGIEVNLRATRRRIARLRRYVELNLLDDNAFICPYFGVCRRSRREGDAFRAGIMSHVGRRFDLRVDGRPLRVVVVGQESGWPKGPGSRQRARRVSLETRYHVVHDLSGLGRRYYTEPAHQGRNPHMRGTTSALRVLLGKALGLDHEDEFVEPTNGRRFHIFDGFALVNRLLCSAGPKGSSEGHPTSTMFDNCLEHFDATMRILEPTIVIFQGHRVEARTRDLFERRRSRGAHLYEADLAGNRVLVCTFSHPSSHGALRWGDRLDAPYLRQVVVPTLRRAIRLL